MQCVYARLTKAYLETRDLNDTCMSLYTNVGVIHHTFRTSGVVHRPVKVINFDAD